METETRKARYNGYGEVEVLQSEGTLSQIRTSGDQEFWVKSEKLVFPKANKEKHATFAKQYAAGKVVVASLGTDIVAAVATALANAPAVALDLETRPEPVLVIESKEEPEIAHDYQHACPDHGEEIAAAVAAPDFKPYKGLAESFPRDLFAWANKHCVRITARAPAKVFDRFAANLLAANDQEFTPLMDGFAECSEKVKGSSLAIRFDAPVPANFLSEIVSLQHRYGIRRDTERSSQLPNVVYCNGLAWDLLRAGHKLGGGKVGQ